MFCHQQAQNTPREPTPAGDLHLNQLMLPLVLSILSAGFAAPAALTEEACKHASMVVEDQPRLERCRMPSEHSGPLERRDIFALRARGTA